MIKMKKLQELYPEATENVEIKRICINSKEIEKGDLFICTMGATADRHDFIDEALTKTFYETGTWDGASHKSMYNEARQNMIKYGMSHDNILHTRELAEAQMRQLLQGLGFNRITILFEPR